LIGAGGAEVFAGADGALTGFISKRDSDSGSGVEGAAWAAGAAAAGVSGVDV
jgi:hypothetical protein